MRFPGRLGGAAVRQERQKGQHDEDIENDEPTPTEGLFHPSNGDRGAVAGEKFAGVQCHKECDPHPSDGRTQSSAKVAHGKKQRVDVAFIRSPMSRMISVRPQRLLILQALKKRPSISNNDPMNGSQATNSRIPSSKF